MSGQPGHVSGLGWPQGSQGLGDGGRGLFLLSLPRSMPSQLPPWPTAVPRAPTSPIAEAVPHDHLLRTPIAIAPAWAKTGPSPSMGTWEARQGPSLSEFSWQPGARPCKPGQSLTLGLLLACSGSPSGPLGNRGLVRPDISLSPPFTDGVLHGSAPTPWKRPSVPPWSPPRTSLLLAPRLTLVIEQSVLHHRAGPPVWKAEARSGSPGPSAPAPPYWGWGSWSPELRNEEVLFLLPADLLTWGLLPSFQPQV